jgi:ring-1,2-phenylacetyl-CoA epoxidase subunit PaaC
VTAAPELAIEPNTRALLGRLVCALADDKAAMGRRYGEWAVSAPTLEAAVAAAAMAQDELGHARSTYPLLKQLDVAHDGEDGMEVSGCMALLAVPLPDWETFVAVNLVVDGMLTAFVRSARESAFTPLAERARKILQEEQSHEVHARAWTRRLTGGQDWQRDSLEASISVCWAAVRDWPGPDEEMATLRAAGLLAESPEGLRDNVRRLVELALADTSLSVTLG